MPVVVHDAEYRDLQKAARRRGLTVSQWVREAIRSLRHLEPFLHRYVAIDRGAAIQPAFDVLLGVVDEVFPVDVAAVERAKSILYGKPRLSARDAIHLATMEADSVTRVMTFGTGFDGFPGVERVH